MHVVSIFALVSTAALVFFNWLFLLNKRTRKQALLNALPAAKEKWPVLGHLPLFMDNSKPRTAVAFEIFNKLAYRFEEQGIFYLRLGNTDRCKIIDSCHLLHLVQQVLRTWCTSRRQITSKQCSPR